MTDREKDEIIARWLGWNVGPAGGWMTRISTNESGGVLKEAGRVPDYSTDANVGHLLRAVREKGMDAEVFAYSHAAEGEEFRGWVDGFDADASTPGAALRDALAQAIAQEEGK